MDSSDSGEDFESADEGLDFEESPAYNKCQSKSSKVCDNIVDINQAEFSRDDTENFHKGLNDVILENESKPSKEVCDIVAEIKEAETPKNDSEIIQQKLNSTVQLEDIPKPIGEVCDNNVTEIKGTEFLSSNPEKIHQRLNDVNLEDFPEPKKIHSDNIQVDVLNVESSDKSKPKPPKKLGTKLMSSKSNAPLVSQPSRKGVHEEKGDNDSLSVNNTQGKANDLSQSQGKVYRTDIHLNKSGSKPENVATNKSELSDGWDFEEEDGFSIPSALSRSNNSNISSSGHDSQEGKGWGSWGGWGVSSILNTATGSVSTFSSQVTAGLSTVLETTVGAPDPETLAASTALAQHESQGTKKGEDMLQDDRATGSYGGLGSLVSGVSLLGSTVINRGLDTLESLGKKTMEVLQEGDPGLKKKRALLFAEQDKPVLSQILREAKEKAEHSDKEKEEKETARKAHFESLFDDFQGMVHLEALEMLSTQCELKLQSMLLGESGAALDDLQETLSQVQDLCEIPDDEDESEVLTREQFNKQLTKCIDGLKIKFSAVKITQANDAVIARLDKLSGESEKALIVHQMAISSLAEFTAAAMECFHKSAELVMAKTIHNTVDEAENYVELTSLLCARVSAIANEFTQLLTKNHPIANSSLITNTFLEASNSSSYTKNACQLLVPILQVGAVSS